ncbi:MAG: flagellar transcriptional regulator FlhD [Ferrovum sp.]|nr:flagellar transcriptional regulator FlhD [Ferrovum sp.]NDU87753.1 flagellar transcriptional regulator FlhD [Ferrovum sp.]
MSRFGKSIAEINLGMLYLAREVLQQDRLQGLLNLGITQKVADTLLALSAQELSHLAQSPVLLVGLRWHSARVWECLSQYATGTDTALPRALLLGEGEYDHVH